MLPTQPPPPAPVRAVARGPWVPGLADALTPVLGPAHAALVDLAASAGAGLLSPDWADAAASALADDLLALAARTLVTELHRARTAGALEGADPAARFTAWTSGLADGGLDDLLARHPVLDRLLRRRVELALAAQARLLGDLASDRVAVVTTLFDGRDPGLVTSSHTAGDLHAGGRGVTIVRFDSGAAVVHRPRPIDLHDRFSAIVRWLDERGGFDLRTLRTVARPDHGWTEFVAARPCPDEAAVHRFYRRQGVLLALLHALDGTDVHHENLVAVGEHPVLVDVETLFHPVLDAPSLVGGDPAVDALRSSVLRTALLPSPLIGDDDEVVDLSGLGSATAAGRTVEGWVDPGLDTMRTGRVPAPRSATSHLPVLDGVPGDPRRHRSALLGGFAAGHDTIARHRAELTAPGGLLDACADVEIRVVARPSSLYAALLGAASHPDALGDESARGAVLGLLTTQPGGAVLDRLVPLELAALDDGDIPLFVTTPSRRDLTAPGGAVVPDALAVTGLEGVRHKLAGLDELDRHLQEWVVDAALASSGAARPAGHRSPPRAGGAAARTRAAHADALLAAAAGIGDEIVARSLTGHGRANWLGLELVDDTDWAVLPMGAGLPQGYSGVALFLMQLASLTGADRFRDLARDALRPLPTLVSALTADLDLAGDAGLGTHGLGGIAYVLGRGIVLDPGNLGLRPTLDAVLGLLEALGQHDGDAVTDLTWDEGLAGALAAMTAVAADTGHPRARALAQRYADELVDALTDGGADGLERGFARGPLGIAFALLRYAATSPDRRADDARPAYGLAGLRLLATPAAAGPEDASGPTGGSGDTRATAVGPATADDGPVSPATGDLGWCTGAAGAVLAHLATRGDGSPGEVSEAAYEAFLAGVLPSRVDDLSPCHGRLGSLDALVELAAVDRAAADLLARATGDVLATLEQDGPRCGTPAGVPTPGLLFGLAGIGHGLLRLGRPDVPSALLLQAGRPACATSP